jgi:hypothetical protein
LGTCGEANDVCLEEVNAALEGGGDQTGQTVGKVNDAMVDLEDGNGSCLTDTRNCLSSKPTQSVFSLHGAVMSVWQALGYR